LAPVADGVASAANASILFDDNGTNVAAHYAVSVGNADAAFATADYVRREHFRSQLHTALPMETRGVLAEYETGGKLIISGRCKDPYCNRGVVGVTLKIVSQ